MSVQIYHNPRCKKSRKGLEYLRSIDEDIEVIDYLKTGISIEQIKFILKISGLSVLDIIRSQEEYYKKNLKGKLLSDEVLIKSISENPKLLQRPIVIKEGKAVLADPPDNINQLFNHRS
ncbi:MAG: arsenate reductase family protein [Bacteroidales bacterium]|nr:arsenate reductase family protein [Bacteroidales bacterium]MCF8389102.1 arsenate reductase family protein [Bacteroidales bacterium]